MMNAKIILEVEQLKATRNAVTAEISQLKRNKENADDKIAEMQKVGETIAQLDDRPAKGGRFIARCSTSLA